MDQNYLQQLIGEVKARSGGLILNIDGKPGAVVLSIEKYNQLLQKSEIPKAFENEINEESEKSFVQLQAQQSVDAEITGHKYFKQTVLITGGAGYIGAHLTRQLINAGHSVIIIDNLQSGNKENIHSSAKFYEGDIGDMNLLRDIFASHKIDAVFHLAAYIEVEESMKEPLKYLENNAINTARLLAAMDEAGVKNLIFSSTAAVYGEQPQQPIVETSPLNPNNPYGYSKYLAEQIINYHTQTRGLNAVIFRYFNACGSDFDGKIQSNHESHLLAKIMCVAAGNGSILAINGNDYDTHDGTCVRDYVHVLDIVSAHILALNRINEFTGSNVFNIGTGTGVSVLEMVNAVSENLNKMIPMEIKPRRIGDAAITIADNFKIKTHLGFEVKFSDLETITKTAFRQMQNRKT